MVAAACKAPRSSRGRIPAAGPPDKAPNRPLLPQRDVWQRLRGAGRTCSMPAMAEISDRFLAHGRGGMMAARIVACAVVLGTPFLVPVALATGRYAPRALALAAIQVVVGAMLVLRRWRQGRVWLAAVLALGTLRALVAWDAPQNVLAVQSGLSHGLLYGWLLLLFGRTLLPGRQPLVTTLAIRLSGRLCAERDVYTRRVTQGWWLFCLFQPAF